MKKLLLLLGMACAIGAHAQSYTADHLLEKQIYDKAWQKLQKALLKDPKDISALYGAYVYYIDNSNPAHDIDQAYHSLYLAHVAFVDKDDKEINRLLKDGLSQELILAKVDTVCETLLLQALERNTIYEMQYYIQHYSLKTPRQLKAAWAQVHYLAFQDATQENTTASYQSFIATYPNAIQVDDAWSRIYQIEWDSTMMRNTAAAYAAYVKTYPKSPLRVQAQQRLYQLEWESACQANSKAAYQRFLGAYEDSPFAKEAQTKIAWFEYEESTMDHTYEQYANYIRSHPYASPVDSARQALYNVVTQQNDYRLIQQTLDNGYLTSQWRDSLLWLLHKVYMDANINNLYSFYSQYRCSYVSELENQDDLIRQAWDDLDLSDYDNCSTFVAIAAPYYVAYYVLQKMIRQDLLQNNYAAALATVEPYAAAFGNDKNYQSLLHTLSAANEGIVKKKLPNTVNSANFSQYSPVLSADSKHLYFCLKDNSENIFVSNLVNGKWSQAQPITELNSQYSNDAPLGISVDGTNMILFSSGILCESTRGHGKWGTPRRLPDNINMCDWQADVHITADGKAMLFAARKTTPVDDLDATDLYRDGNFQSTNIFVSLLDEDGNWSPAIDLGPTINTAFCDRSPFLHPDGKTLYFSSYGHGSIGDMDVFMSRRLSEDSWTEWSEPVNMGKEINTPGSDWGYKITTDGAFAYFSVASDGRENLYSCNIPKHLRPNMVAVVSGKLTDKKGDPISTEIRWEDLTTSTEVGISHTNPDDGSYYMVLPLGKEYGYYVDHEDFFPISNSIDLTKAEKAQTITQDLQTISYSQMIEEELPVPMNNLFFETGKFGLKPTSYAELKRVAKIINQHQLYVEISGHTDNVGDEAQNLALSEQRATAVRDYLIDQGCSPDLLSAKGKGASQPVAPNDTEANRKKNRRVELRFVHYL